LMWAVAVVVSAALLVINAYRGELNQDEGWYLYAARLASEGRMPYRDFAFTQGPVMAFTYALARPLVTASGLLGGRLFTVALALVGMACAAGLAARVTAGRKCVGAFLATVLVGVNVYQSYFCSIVKTYSLASAWLMAGLLVLGLAEGRKGHLAAFVGGVLMALAAGTRITLVVAPLVASAWLLVRARRYFLAFTVGAAAAGCLVFVPFLVSARDNFVFCMAGYHAAREASGLSALLLRAGSLSRLLGAYSVAFAALCGAAVARLAVGKREGYENRAGRGDVQAAMPGILWTSVVLIGLGHLSAPFPYDDYQAVVFPVLAAALASWVAGISVRLSSKGTAALGAGMLVVSLGAAAASPIAQGWVVKGHDRLWVVRREQAPLALLQEVGRYLRQQAGEDGEILTQDIYLAVETGLTVPPGLEMGQFSYFPDMDRAEAEERKVVNRETLRELLAGCDATVAAFSGYGLSVRCPDVSELSREEQDELWAIVGERYEPLKTVEGFGQAGTTLRILRRRNE